MDAKELEALANKFLDGLGEMAQARADAETLGNEYDGEPPQVEVVTRWYARGGDVVRMGPYETQAAAMRALVLVGSDPEKPSYPPNAYAWPEEFRE